MATENRLTQIPALDDVGVEREEEVVAGLAQLADRHRGRAVDEAGAVELENRVENRRTKALGQLVLTAVVGLHEFQPRSEHSEHTEMW